MLAPDPDEPLHRQWIVSALWTELEAAREWGLTYAQWLEQPPEHRALMQQFCRYRATMEAIEMQEQRERRGR